MYLCQLEEKEHQFFVGQFLQTVDGETPDLVVGEVVVKQLQGHLQSDGCPHLQQSDKNNGTHTPLYIYSRKSFKH